MSAGQIAAGGLALSLLLSAGVGAIVHANQEETARAMRRIDAELAAHPRPEGVTISPNALPADADTYEDGYEDGQEDAQ